MACARDNEMVMAAIGDESGTPSLPQSRYQPKRWHKLLPVTNLLLGVLVFSMHRLRNLI